MPSLRPFRVRPIRPALLAIVTALGLVACGGGSGGTDAGGSDAGLSADADAKASEGPARLLPGPGAPGHDAAVAAKLLAHERLFRAIHSAAMGVNTDVAFAVDSPARKDLAAFAALAPDAPKAWDFAAFAGYDPLTKVSAQRKVAGLYAGVGIAADAYRYQVLRDEGAPKADVDRARAALLAGLETLHTAIAITGTPGVIARGLARSDLPGDGERETTPLFDASGAPLPAKKNNGEWRADRSPDKAYPTLIWEDSISRDQYLGWVLAFAAAWETIRGDDSFAPALSIRLRADALGLARELTVVRASGYDLELYDADGRRTLHGTLHEHNFDGVLYTEALDNGFHALMTLGIVGAWVYVTEDPQLTAWLHKQLLGPRKLDVMVAEQAGKLIDTGNKTNYSATNMAFTAAWLGLRYLGARDPASASPAPLSEPETRARAAIREALHSQLYDREGSERQPADFAYALYDLIYVAGRLDTRAGAEAQPLPSEGPLPAALAKARATLQAYPAPPYWNVGQSLCKGWDCKAKPVVKGEATCTAPDGTTYTALGCVARNDDLMVAEPIAFQHLPPSNYHWRSGPYLPNRAGDGTLLLPAVDLRFAYWLGRVVRVAAQPGG